MTKYESNISPSTSNWSQLSLNFIKSQIKSFSKLYLNSYLITYFTKTSIFFNPKNLSFTYLIKSFWFNYYRFLPKTEENQHILIFIFSSCSIINSILNMA